MSLLSQESRGLPAQSPSARSEDPAQLACVDPQLLEANFDFGPFKDSDPFDFSDASAVFEPILSANPGLTGLSPPFLPSWVNSPYPPALLLQSSSKELDAYGLRPTGENFSPAATDDDEDSASDHYLESSKAICRRTRKSSKHVETSSIPTTDEATPKQGATPKKKRGRKPRIKTEEEKERQLQRQRQRNRLAATRCRSKKKGETWELEQNAEYLRERRDSLRSTLDGLSSEVLDLKEAVIKHRYCESGEVKAYIRRQFHQLVGPSLKSSSTSQNTTPELVSDDFVLAPLSSPTLSMGSR